MCRGKAGAASGADKPAASGRLPGHRRSIGVPDSREAHLGGRAGLGGRHTGRGGEGHRGGHGGCHFAPAGELMDRGERGRVPQAAAASALGGGSHVDTKSSDPFRSKPGACVRSRGPNGTGAVGEESLAPESPCLSAMGAPSAAAALSRWERSREGFSKTRARARATWSHAPSPPPGACTTAAGGVRRVCTRGSPSFAPLIHIPRCRNKRRRDDAPTPGGAKAGAGKK